MSLIYNWKSKAIKPKEPVNTASAFAQWVFEQSNDQTRVPNLSTQREKMQKGSYAHLVIDNYFKYRQANSINYQSKSISDWIIEHTEEDGRAGKFYKASNLLVNDKPLNCSPDVVLRHKSKSQVIIIERKTTFQKNPQIPALGWPNVQAQLWCYSWIDSMLDIDEVLLVNQVWIAKSIGYFVCSRQPTWKKGDSEISNKCLSWFKLYGGKFNPQGPQ